MTNIKLNNDGAKKPVNNFWNHIHFHPTDAIEDDWGREILDRCAADGAVNSVRMYTMLEDIVSLDENGNFKYDYTLNDQRLDYMIEKGFDVVLCYNFIPPCIASDAQEVNAVNKRKTRYKGKMINVSPPKDYKLWEEICENYTRHIVEKYGEEQMSRWLFQCYNEPDATPFWMKNEKDMDIRLREYCKLYYHFEKAFTSVSTTLKIGGPALAESFEFLDGFLKFVNEQKLKLDFVCVHTYGSSPGKINQNIKPIHHANSVEKIEKVFEICSENGFDKPNLVIDEWGLSVAGYFNVLDCPKLIIRENSGFAAYFAKMITLYVEKEYDLERIMICLSGQHEIETEFCGNRTFFTMSGYAKPIYSAYVLTGKLGDSLLEYQCENADDNLSILATEDKDGNVKVLLGYASPNFDEKLDDKEITFTLSNADDYNGYFWTIDEEKASPMYAYEKYAGNHELINEKSNVQREDLGSVNGAVTVTVKNNSCTLIELIKA